jgi:hypothetical protein
LGPCPEFEILPPVVLAYAVAVMDGFLRQQMTPEDLFHYQDVFEDVPTLASPWMARRPDHDVPGFMAGAPAIPVAV